MNTAVGHARTAGTAALMRWIQSARNVRFLRLRSRKAVPAFEHGLGSTGLVFLRRPEKPLVVLEIFLGLV